MPRNMRQGETQRRSKAKRDAALARTEFAYPSAPRVPASGATSFALKADDPNDRALIEAALAKRGPKT